MCCRVCTTHPLLEGISADALEQEPETINKYFLHYRSMTQCSFKGKSKDALTLRRTEQTFILALQSSEQQSL